MADDADIDNQEGVVLAPVRVADRALLFTPTFVLMMISIILNAAGLIGIVLITNDTNKVVGDINARSSPEAQARQADAIEQIIEQIAARVDCNSRFAIEEALNELGEDLALPVITITENCPRTKE